MGSKSCATSKSSNVAIKQHIYSSGKNIFPLLSVQIAEIRAELP